MSPDDTRHGTANGYRRGCRNECCRRAKMREQEMYRAGRIPGKTPIVGIARRIQALLRMGWTSREIGATVGQEPKWATLLVHRCESVNDVNARRVLRAYAELCMKTPPHNRYRRRNQNFAERMGWPPPLAWDDIDNPDEQPHAGRDASHYLADELVSEWDHLRRAGESIDQAARQLGVTVGAIEKALERVGKVSAA